LTLRAFVRLFTYIQLLPVVENGEETTFVGGQAVMEGVMMRSPHSYCVAVRKQNGEIVTQESPLARISERYPIFKLPVIRGLGTLGSAMWLGMRALKFSTDCLLQEYTGDKPAEPKKEVGRMAMGLQIVLSLAFMIGLYKLLPLVIATQIGHHVAALQGRFAINMVDGAVRIGVFLIFMYALSRLPDMHRMFQYHGAEHKVVFNFESGKPLSVPNAQSFVTWHPRCGTSFLMVLLVVSMICYAFLPIDNFWAKLVARVALLPLIVGISYEVIRFAAQRQSSLMALLTKPGLWLQRITTQAPTDSQVEVAIYALDHAMELEQAQGGQLVIA
jgi:uncharacterized protein YqhQ